MIRQTTKRKTTKKRTTKRVVRKRSLGTTATALNNLYPLWDKGQTNTDGGHTTQRANTVNTYKKIGAYLKKAGKFVSILDASSGLGEGTIALRTMGFAVDDVEPYVNSKKRSVKATFSKYEQINRKYDVVISNCVLNVIPDDYRDGVLRDMAKCTATGGRMIINVRPADSIAAQKQKIELENAFEILVLDGKKNIVAYQKGFTKKELQEYCQKKLGPKWRVVVGTVANCGINNGCAVVCYKE